MRNKRVTAKRLAKYMDELGYGHDFRDYRNAHEALYRESNGVAPRHYLYMDDSLYLSAKEKRD